jgi:hypothetical protein
MSAGDELYLVSERRMPDWPCDRGVLNPGGLSLKLPPSCAVERSEPERQDIQQMSARGTQSSGVRGVSRPWTQTVRCDLQIQRNAIHRCTSQEPAVLALPLEFAMVFPCAAALERLA